MLIVITLHVKSFLCTEICLDNHTETGIMNGLTLFYLITIHDAFIRTNELSSTIKFLSVRRKIVI